MENPRLAFHRDSDPAHKVTDSQLLCLRLYPPWGTHRSLLSSGPRVLKAQRPVQPVISWDPK